MKDIKPEYISKAGLTGKRGWTGILMDRFLPEPDKITDNPYYKSSAQMKLWLLEKITAIEETPEFKVMFESAKTRKKSASKAVETKRATILKWVHDLNITLPELTEEQLTEKAISSYNNHNSRKSMEYGYDYEPATPDSDPEFLNRISINYLRHKCTHYEGQLNQIYGKVGNEEAYQILKKKINNAILDKFKFLYPVQQF